MKKLGIEHTAYKLLEDFLEEVSLQYIVGQL